MFLWLWKYLHPYSGDYLASVLLLQANAERPPDGHMQNGFLCHTEEGSTTSSFQQCLSLILYCTL